LRPNDPPFLAWHGDQPLMTLGRDVWRIKDACEGTMIFGGTGSGKTSGSGQTLARSYLSAGFGGLVLCAKTDEPSLWKRYAAESGRESDVILFGGPEPWKFNFMNYESERPGVGAGLTENLIHLFVEVASIGAGSGAGRGGDPFWERAMKSLVRNCIDLLTLAGEPVSLHAMSDIIRTAPTEPGCLQSQAWKESSSCWRLLETIAHPPPGTPAAIDGKEVRGYWLAHFPTLGDRTRGSIVAMFSTLAESLMRGRMRELFCSESNLTPEDILAGKIVIVDLPVKEWAEVGRFAAILWKYCLQKAVERRLDNAEGTARPVFLWADECQHFASRYDSSFQATARSSRAATVYLTQNYPNLVVAMGSEANDRALVDSLLGNLGTKLFHANSDRETNHFASELLGRRLQQLHSSGAGVSLSVGGRAGLGSSAHRGSGEHMEYEIQPREFTTLRMGGPENQFSAEALLFQNGRIWKSTGKTWQKIAFPQIHHALAADPAAGDPSARPNSPDPRPEPGLYPPATRIHPAASKVRR